MRCKCDNRQRVAYRGRNVEVAEPSVAHRAAEPRGLAMENCSPRPGERRRSADNEVMSTDWRSNTAERRGDA
jgi:hypothetical protein